MEHPSNILQKKYFPPENYYLVVEPTHLKNMRQIGSSPQVGDKNQKKLETTT